jgi:hypothetical protein
MKIIFDEDVKAEEIKMYMISLASLGLVTLLGVWEKKPSKEIDAHLDRLDKIIDEFARVYKERKLAEKDRGLS